MSKDDLTTQEELSVAAASYIPPFWLIFCFFKRWRGNYFTRYHMAHSFLIGLFNLFFLLLTGLLTLWISSWSGYNYWLILLSGSMIGLSLLWSAGVLVYCGWSAYQGRYIVLPVVTRIFYALFSLKPQKPQKGIHHLVDFEQLKSFRKEDPPL